MKLLCDNMLAGLAKWLRAAGHDAELRRPGEGDRALLARARAEDRLLLTRNRHLLDFREAPGRVLLLRPNRLDEAARALREAFGLDWQAAPFSRCLICNRPLEGVRPGPGDPVPGDVREGPVRRCPECGRFYWPGSHVRRMQARLAAWAGP